MLNRRRKGNYTVLFAISLTILLGFSALSIDVSRLRLASTQIQTAADAGARAAMLVLRDGGDTSDAAEVAAEIAQLNLVGGVVGGLEVQVDIGNWDWDASRDSAFAVDSRAENAVQVTVRRSAGGSAGEMGLIFAPLIGGPQAVAVSSAATAAIRNREIVLVVDGTLDFADYIVDAANGMISYSIELSEYRQSADQIGMVMHSGEAEVFTALQEITGVGAPQVAFEWAGNVAPCAMGFSPWADYYRYLTDVEAEAFPDPSITSLNLRARGVVGEEGWDPIEEHMYASFTGFDLMVAGESDCINDNVTYPTSEDKDWCSWQISLLLYQTYVDTIGDPTSLLMCNLGNTWEDHELRFDPTDVIADVNSSFGVLTGGPRDNYGANSGSSPGAGMTLALDMLTGFGTDDKADKLVVLIAGSDPECTEDGAFDPDQCTEDREDAALDAAHFAEVNDITTHVIYIGADDDLAILPDMTTGEGVFYSAENAALITGFLNEIVSDVPVELLR